MFRFLGFCLVICLAQGFLTGCEELGLEDDGGGNRQSDETEEPVLPPLEITEPQVAFPFTKFLYFSGLDRTEPEEENPRRFVYSYDIANRSVLRQSAGQSARTIGFEIPLGKGRFTQGYNLIEENGRYFRASPSERTLSQLGSVNLADLELCQEFARAEGLGLENQQFLLSAALPDTACGDFSNERYRISLDAGVTTEPTNIVEGNFSQVPVYTEGYVITGYLQANGATSIDVLSADGELLNNLSGLTSSEFYMHYLDRDGEVLLHLDRQLYLVAAKELVNDSAALVPLVSLSSEQLLADQLLINASEIFLRDGQRILRIDREQKTAIQLVDLSNYGTEFGYLTELPSELLLRTDDGALLAVNKASGEQRTLLASSAPGYLAAADYVYGNVVTADGSTAYLLKAGTTPMSCPASNGEAGEETQPIPKSVRQPATSGENESFCTAIYDAEWVFIRENSDRGIEYHPILWQGFGDENYPAFQQGYFNNTVSRLFAEEFGRELTILENGLAGQYRVEAAGIVEQGHGLLAIRQLPDTDTTYADIYYFNTGESGSLKNVSKSALIEEQLLHQTRLK